VTPPRPLPSLEAFLAGGQARGFGPGWPGTEPLPPGFGPTARQLIDGHLQLLMWNAITVKLLRETRARKGAGYDKWIEDPVNGMGPFTVRFHQPARGSAQVSEANTGSQERDATWGVIMDASVPLRSTDGEDGSVRVTFWHPTHGQLRLRRLRALEAHGYLWGWQADCERISGTGPEHRVGGHWPATPAPPDQPPDLPVVPRSLRV